MPPVDLQLTRHYYKAHIEDITRQFKVVKDLGSGSAEEWIKGLDSMGREWSNDIARWEQWEAQGGLKKVNLRPNQKHISSMAKRPVPPNSVSAMVFTPWVEAGRQTHSESSVTANILAMDSSFAQVSSCMILPEFLSAT